MSPRILIIVRHGFVVEAHASGTVEVFVRDSNLNIGDEPLRVETHTIAKMNELIRDFSDETNSVFAGDQRNRPNYQSLQYDD